mmetsp:Transcript_15910/g.24558  ORF Transcript_15910/g.24558 Transcript_15910/m.24558 type:complete len:226 (+) Transcript_15910:371-1048(+)|eukprot:CAMPEP_0170489356 /NCGR_PEP_ID=MMETSP0208-20121228/7712_1 /TAXON_ID=197538 /ORGANISM="Strombidium inclinatum, Strain S3" /LENGTH=225 /DNA_ID=CAMNT_0010764239 /DNA_START=303 /DNA_END=980 /DNA_ORIENTATION=-
MFVRQQAKKLGLPSIEDPHAISNVPLIEIKEKLPEVFSKEELFLEQIFDSDAKNYHAWSHKIWLVERYCLWNEDAHMDFVDKMLDQDPRNNSVWSYRYFIKMGRVRSSALKAGRSMAEQWKENALGLVEGECMYVLLVRLRDNYDNEAAWAYLRGFLATSEKEAEESLTTNAKRWNMAELGGVTAILDTWEQDLIDFQTSTATNVDPEMLMRVECLSKNRFYFHT